MFKRFYPAFIAIIMFASIFYINGCKDNALTSTQENVTFGYISSSDTADHVGNLVLDTVKILLKDIKLNGSGNDANFKTGPFVLNLSLPSLGVVNPVGSAYIVPGTYDKIKFEVHKLNSNETVPDPEFIDGNNSYSVVAKGTFNGNRFIFKSDKSANQILNFPNALVVSTTTTNVSLRIQPYIWFIDQNTGLYLDPNDSTAHNTIDNNIKDNIKGNFKAFKDDDKNGIPD